MEQGAMIKQEFGSDGFVKTTGMFSTGLLDDKFAFMAQGVRKTGDGQRLGTWTDAWAYYVGASWLASETNRLDLFALGAPQSHGQNLYKQNIGAYSTEYALSLSDYDPMAAEAYPQSRQGECSEIPDDNEDGIPDAPCFDYNENFNTVNPSYSGLQAYGSNFHERQDPGFINERENFFHKPQVNLNWYSVLSPSLNLTTVTYYSGGRGGGTGTLGSIIWDYSGPSRIADWDATIARNQTDPDGESSGILRASRNNQWTIGAISKLKKEFDSPLTMEVGIDWRTAQIEHYRDVFDLLGGEYFMDDSNDFTGDRARVLGDTIDYNYTNTVDWVGGYLQAEYATDGYTLYGMGGLSTVKYSFNDHFADDGTGQEVYSETDNINGYQLKGGALLNVSDEIGVYTNVGYVSKVPIFDGAIDDFSGRVNADPVNETFTSVEAGVNYNSLDRALAAAFNVYFTQWNDRTRTRNIVDENGVEGLVSLQGLDARHMGVEAELSYRVSDMFRIDVGGAIGDWKYTDDVSGEYQSAPGAPPTPFDYYVKDLKVGDQPQSSASVALSVFPTEGLFLQVVGRANGKHYAEFDPFSRTDPDDRVQSWQIPGYTVADAHASYRLPADLSIGKDARIFVHVFNLTDETYILEAVDNSSFNAFDDDHDADDAEVYFGLGRRINVGMQVGF
jgi:iron complex outermembrane receptor protein